MTREIELNGKHKGSEPLLATIVIDRVIDGFQGSRDEPAYEDSADYYVEGISDIHAELYKEDILYEVTCMLAERSEAIEDYFDEEYKYYDDEYPYFNEDGDSPF
jgi:hypothetical protein